LSERIERNQLNGVNGGYDEQQVASSTPCRVLPGSDQQQEFITETRKLSYRKDDRAMPHNVWVP